MKFSECLSICEIENPEGGFEQKLSTFLFRFYL